MNYQIVADVAIGFVAALPGHVVSKVVTDWLAEEVVEPAIESAIDSPLVWRMVDNMFRKTPDLERVATAIGSLLSLDSDEAEIFAGQILARFSSAAHQERFAA